MKKLSRLFLAAVVAMAAGSFVRADDKPADKPKYTPGSCCDKADKKGEKCKHPCCVAAEKEGKVCTKCNPPKAEK